MRKGKFGNFLDGLSSFLNCLILSESFCFSEKINWLARYILGICSIGYNYLANKNTVLSDLMRDALNAQKQLATVLSRRKKIFADTF